VASNIADIPDIANESQAGILVEPGDAGALGRAIETLLADAGDWSRRSALGWEWVNKICTSKRVGSPWHDAYVLLTPPSKMRDAA